MKKIEITAVADHMKGGLDAVLSGMVLTADGWIKEANPVLSGRMAASWQIGENDVSGEPKEPGVYSNPGPPKGSNYKPGTEKAGEGNVYILHNNLPYAERVCFQGWSDKNTRDWFVKISKDIARYGEKIFDSPQKPRGK